MLFGMGEAAVGGILDLDVVDGDGWARRMVGGIKSDKMRLCRTTRIGTCVVRRNGRKNNAASRVKEFELVVLSPVVPLGLARMDNLCLDYAASKAAGNFSNWLLK